MFESAAIVLDKKSADTDGCAASQGSPGRGRIQFHGSLYACAVVNLGGLTCARRCYRLVSEPFLP